MASLIDIFESSVVGASLSATFTSAVIPNGKKVTVRRFGGFVQSNNLADGRIILEWGSAASFSKIRVLGGMHEVAVDMDFTGDGVKRFRIIRQNLSLLNSIEIHAWARAIIL